MDRLSKTGTYAGRMWAVARRLAAGISLVVLSLTHGAAETRKPGNAVLSLDEARAYMVEMVNRDRAALGLKPVTLDPVANSAAQRHAEDMARYAYMAHWDRDGKLPDQRYTEAGGRGAVSENAFLRYGHPPGSEQVPLELAPAVMFTRHEIEEIEAAYFNEEPPYDSHRLNISDPRHTHVGIGLVRAQFGGQATALANTQEFVNQWAELDGIPAQVRIGDTVVVSGRVASGAAFVSVELARMEAPQPMSRDDLRKVSTYPVPKPFAVYREEAYDSPVPVSVSADGRFRVPVVLSDQNRPGLYYIVVRATTGDRRAFPISRRTIVVK